MAHPKRKISKTRRDKRRTHYKAESPAFVKCSTTGVYHVPHRMYEVDGNMYYNGKLVTEAAAEGTAS